MILEEATYEAYGYEVWELSRGSTKPVLAACEFCGKFRVLKRLDYHTFCHSCSVVLGEKQKGEKHPMFDKHHSEATKALMSAGKKGKTGEEASNWQGGISFEPYCIKFNNAFKDYIRAKFGFKCFLCPTTQEENGRNLSVHHVNYNKDCGCDSDETCNFVPLCISCHMKTNRNRDYWQKLITEKLHNTIIGWKI